MATTKKPAASASNEPVMDIDELDEKIEKGEVVLPQQVVPEVDKLWTGKNIEKFVLGEITWAQLQGMTVDEAYNIAEYGFGLYQEGKYHDARTIFEGLVVCNPYDAYFHNMLGAVYQQLDMKDEAAEEYTLAIELDPEQLHAHVNRGELYLQSGEFDKALDDLKRAIELDPDGRDPAGVRARALAMATANAMEAIQKLLKDVSKKKAPEGGKKEASPAKAAPKPTPQAHSPSKSKAGASTGKKPGKGR
jgi:type III secretion system low calcium response chaperone LcrH/SycD